jgi:hypothetical protein
MLRAFLTLLFLSHLLGTWSVAVPEIVRQLPDLDPSRRIRSRSSENWDGRIAPRVMIISMVRVLATSSI